MVFTPLAHLIYGSLLWAFCYTGLPLTAYSLACFVLSRLFPDPLGISHDPANMGSSAAHRANHATPPDALVWLRQSASLLANNTKSSGLCFGRPMLRSRWRDMYITAQVLGKRNGALNRLVPIWARRISFVSDPSIGIQYAWLNSPFGG